MCFFMFFYEISCFVQHRFLHKLLDTFLMENGSNMAPILNTHLLLFRSFSVPFFGYRFWDAFWPTLGSLLAPFGSFLAPFGSLWLPFGSLLAPFGSLLAPMGTLLAPFGSLLLTSGLHFSLLTSPSVMLAHFHAISSKLQCFGF